MLRNNVPSDLIYYFKRPNEPLGFMYTWWGTPVPNDPDLLKSA